jgi:hypothetical protein
MLFRRLFLLGLLAGTAFAQPLVIHGSFRTRVEAWGWFDGSANSEYAFSGNQARFSLGLSGKGAEWLLELEAPILLGMPTDASAPGALGAMGLGGNYTAANDRSANTAMIFAKQAYLRLKSDRQALRLGRFEFSDGAEMTPSDPTLAWIKRERVAQRLIGPFGWSHVGRSFDGAHYTWGTSSTNVTVMGARPTRGAFQVDGWGELDVALGYAAVTHARPHSDMRLFGAYYQDWRCITKTDNRLAAARALDRQNIRIGTFGGHYAGASRGFDVLLWGALQTGRWDTLDHRAYAVAAEAGWQPKARLRPWLRAGYFRSSGDGNLGDNRHETFFQMLPTPRPYARTPFFNMMNNEDAFAALILRPHKAVNVRGEFHNLRLSDRNDLWYSGGGAFQPWSFGYVGRPSGGSRDLARLYDVSLDYTINPHWSATVYYGRVIGGDVIRSIYPGTNANFGYLEMTTRF